MAGIMKTDLNEKELRQEINQKLKIKRKCKQETLLVDKLRQELRKRFWNLTEEISRGKERVGAVKGQKCPALRKIKDSGYATYRVICRAKRYRYSSWTKEEMYRSHCYHCHLTPKEAKISMDYDTILKGKRKDE